MTVKYFFEGEYPGFSEKNPTEQAKCGLLFLEFLMEFLFELSLVEQEEVN